MFDCRSFPHRRAVYALAAGFVLFSSEALAVLPALAHEASRGARRAPEPCSSSSSSSSVLPSPGPGIGSFLWPVPMAALAKAGWREFKGTGACSWPDPIPVVLAPESQAERISLVHWDGTWEWLVGRRAPGPGAFEEHLPALTEPLRMASCPVAAPGGVLYYADRDRVRRMTVERRVETVAIAEGNVNALAFCPRDGSVVFSCQGKDGVWQVQKAGPGDRLELVAGGSTGRRPSRHGSSGAERILQAVCSLAFSPQGDLFIAESGAPLGTPGQGRILRLRAGGDGLVHGASRVTTVAGGGSLTSFSGPGNRATQASLNYPRCLCPTPEGGLYFVQALLRGTGSGTQTEAGDQICHVSPSGGLWTVAGGQGRGGSGPMTPAVGAWMPSLAETGITQLSWLPGGGLIAVLRGGELRVMGPEPGERLTWLVRRGLTQMALMTRSAEPGSGELPRLEAAERFSAVIQTLQGSPDEDASGLWSGPESHPGAAVSPLQQIRKVAALALLGQGLPSSSPVPEASGGRLRELRAEWALAGDGGLDGPRSDGPEPKEAGEGKGIAPQDGRVEAKALPARSPAAPSRGGTARGEADLQERISQEWARLTVAHETVERRRLGRPGPEEHPATGQDLLGPEELARLKAGMEKRVEKAMAAREAAEWKRKMKILGSMR